MHILEVFRLPFHLGCLDHLQIQHEEKGFMVSASSNMAVLASIWGVFFFLVTFKLPFHALPLLSPHPASFRSFTPGGLKFIICQNNHNSIPYVPSFAYICTNLPSISSPSIFESLPGLRRNFSLSFLLLLKRETSNAKSSLHLRPCLLAAGCRKHQKSMQHPTSLLNSDTAIGTARWTTV